jgi:hypothetical protein
MLALRAIVAADGQHPLPSSREHASASASSTRRSLPEVGEFAHTQFITAVLTAAAPSHPRSRAGLDRLGQPRPTRACRSGEVSDSGSETGAASFGQKPSCAAIRRRILLLTWADAPGQHGRTDARLVQDEEAAGSNPATPTASSLVNTLPGDHVRLPRGDMPEFGSAGVRFWERPGRD